MADNAISAKPSKRAGERLVPFPDELCAQIVEALWKRHAGHLSSDEEVAISGEMGHGRAQAKCVLQRLDRTFRLVVETCVRCEPNGIENPLDARDAALDYMDVVLIEFFEKERFVQFRPVWQEFEMEGVVVLMRGEITNPHLEGEANDFLAKHGFGPEGDQI